jgi:site-specific recombinase XerD
MKHTRRSSRRQLSGPTAHGASTFRPTSKPSRQPIDVTALHNHYVAYLRDEKGLARNSILVYSLQARNYLATQVGKRGQVLQRAFDVNTMRAYILEYSKGRSGEYIRLMTVSLRSLCHFFFLHGYTSSDLSEAIPRFRKHRLASVPNYLTPEQVESVLGATDRSTRTGSRDYAILLLLARLGLRASEVVSLTLEDIRWRSSEITIHGKGQVVERVPLLSDIGEAIATYLRDFRQHVPTRHLFLSG